MEEGKFIVREVESIEEFQTMLNIPEYENYILHSWTINYYNKIVVVLKRTY